MIQPPEPPDGWLDGPLGVLRAAAILLGAALIGLAIGGIDAAMNHSAQSTESSVR